MAKLEQVSLSNTTSYFQVKIPLKKKRSVYLSYYLEIKKKKNYSIELNNQNEAVQLLNISDHKEPRISLEIQQDKEIFDEENNGFDENSTTDSTNKKYLSIAIINT